MTATLAHIFRHPVKSIGYEEIENAPLTEGRVLPFDRIWALSTEEASFDSPLAAWSPKRNFLRGAVAAGLMAVQSRRRDDGLIEFTHPDLWALTIDPDRPEDQRKLLQWIAPLWPAKYPRPRAVEKPGVALTDSSERFVSILSATSLADFGRAVEQDLSPHRFRGNLWIDGWAPWAERDLIGRALRIGEAELEVIEPIVRCRATRANPETGVEDFDTLGALKSVNGDTTFGVFALVRAGGEIARGDTVETL